MSIEAEAEQPEPEMEVGTDTVLTRETIGTENLNNGQKLSFYQKSQLEKFD